MFGNKTQDIIGGKGYIVAGQLSFAQIDENDKVVGGYLPVGSISSLNLSPSITKVTKKETISGQNQVTNEIVTGTEVNVTINFEDVTIENLENFFFGSAVIDTLGQTGVSHTISKAYTGAVNPLGVLLDSDGAVVVQDSADTITYEEGKNYEVQNGDIYIYNTSEQTANGAAELIANEDELHLTFDTLPDIKIDAFTKTQVRVAAYFSGINTAMGDAPIIFEFPKLALDPSDFDALSTEDFASFSVSGTLLKARGKELFTVKLT